MHMTALAILIVHDILIVCMNARVRSLSYLFDLAMFCEMSRCPRHGGKTIRDPESICRIGDGAYASRLLSLNQCTSIQAHHVNLHNIYNGMSAPFLFIFSTISFLDPMPYTPSTMILATLLLLTTPLTSAYWQPPSGTSFQIDLSNTPRNTTTPYTAFDTDLFATKPTFISSLHASNRKAICYFSAGSYENWRPDASQFNKTTDLGAPLQGWPGEWWLNTNSANVRRIMSERIALAKSKGCDAIDPDNVDGYDNDNGLGLTRADAVNYVEFLAQAGHAAGMAVGLKNAGEIIPQVLGVVEFSVNEQCLQYQECDTFQPFTNAGKPVFHIEYVKGTPGAKYVTRTCNDASARGFSTIIKHMSLDEWAVACPAGSTGVDVGVQKTQAVQSRATRMRVFGGFWGR